MGSELHGYFFDNVEFLIIDGVVLILAAVGRSYRKLPRFTAALSES